MAETRSPQPPDDSRRRFLKYSGTAIGGAIVGGVIGGAIARNMRTAPETPGPTPGAEQPNTAANYTEALMFFNQAQFRLTEAAAERIYPKDEHGPGAQELGAAFYIDHQLAGAWGHNAREYRQGPFAKGEATQGDYQSIKRNELFLFGLGALDETSVQQHQKPFIDLSDEQKDGVIATFEKGDVVIVPGITSKTFFNLLRNLTIEGVYSDPLYGGNKDMAGWKMRNYPGNQMTYLDIMEKDELVVIPPKSLHDHFAGH